MIEYKTSGTNLVRFGRMTDLTIPLYRMQAGYTIKRSQAMKWVKQLWIMCLTATLVYPGSVFAVDWSAKYPIARDFPGPYSYESTSRLDLKGVTLHVVVINGTIVHSTERHARQFEELTGAIVVVHKKSWDTLYGDMIRGIQSGKYDIAMNPQQWLIDLAPYTEPLPKTLLESPQYLAVASPYDAIGLWDGQHKEVFIDGDRHYLQYRKDLLDDPTFKKEFKEKTGNDLKPPATWKELNAIAAFFNGREINGRKIYGMAEVTNPEGMLFSVFLKRTAPYVKHPAVRGGTFFDAETMEIQIDNPGYIEALKDMVETARYYPPGWKKFGIDEVVKQFADGHVVFSDMWDDAFIASMEKDSAIRGKVGVIQSPGSRAVWNRKDKKWHAFPDVNYAPYIAEGWASIVSAKSKHKKSAFAFLGFFSNEANHRSDLLYGASGINPFRESDANPDFWIKEGGWPQDVAASYTTVLNDITSNANRMFFLHLYRGRHYGRKLSSAVFQALSGLVDPQKALAEAAKGWENETRIVGIDKQRKAYKNMIRLEENK